MSPRIGVLALQGGVVEHAEMLRKIEGVDVCEVKSAAELATCDGIVLPGGESTTIARLLKFNDLMIPLREWVKNKKPIFGTCAGLILLSNEVESVSKQGQDFIGGLNIKCNRNHYGRQLASFEATLNAPVLSALPLDSSLRGTPTLSTSEENTGAACGFDNARATTGRVTEKKANDNNADEETNPNSSASENEEANMSQDYTMVSTPAASAVFIRAPGILEVREGVTVLASIEHEGKTLPVAVQQENILALTFHPELTSDSRWHRFFAEMCANVNSRRERV